MSLTGTWLLESVNTVGLHRWPFERPGISSFDQEAHDNSKRDMESTAVVAIIAFQHAHLPLLCAE